MLRKLIHWLPKNALSLRRIHHFSQQPQKPEQPPKQKKPTLWQKPNLSNALERHFLRYIKQLSSTKSQNFRGQELKDRMKKFERRFNIKNQESNQKDNLKNNDQDSKKTSQNDRNKDKKNDKNKDNEEEVEDPEEKKKKIRLFSIILATMLVFMNSNQRGGSIISTGSRTVSESQMLTLLAGGNFNPDVIIVRQMVANNAFQKPVYQTICLAKERNKIDTPVTCLILNLPFFLQKLQTLPYNVSFNYGVPTVSEKSPISFSSIVLGAVAAYVIYKIRKGGFSGLSKGGIDQMLKMKSFEPIKPENIKTSFKDVAGMHEAKIQITEFVDFLKHPEKYLQMGAKIPKGALLTGPPGTGKTLLARACAGEAGVPFFYVSGSEFVEKYVGLGANRVRKLFQAAAKASPSIVFIDEIDAIGKKRSSGPFSNEQRQNTLNQLLVNMDGFDTKNKIIVMAATNLKDSLDPALLRPGRFDRAIQIGLPSFEERIEILKVHLGKVKFAGKYTIDELAKKVSVLTPGFSGAELANICNQAAILAARTNKNEIDLPEFEKATERVMAGLQKRNIFSDEEKECLAYYECGKAVASWFTEGADPIIKISIAPFSKSSKGYSHQIKDQMPLKTQQELRNKVICYLAGRAAQKKFKGFITSNGDTDMKKAKRIITYLVVKLGMSRIGRIGYPDIEYTRKPYSEDTQCKINEEIERIYGQCLTKTQQLINEKVETIEKLKEAIMVKETLTHNSLKEILGQRPFSDHENYEKFLKDSRTEPTTQNTGNPEAVMPQ